MSSNKFFCVMLIAFFAFCHDAGAHGTHLKDGPLQRKIRIEKSIVDIRDLLDHLSRFIECSLIVGHGVRGMIEYPGFADDKTASPEESDMSTGETIENVLNNALSGRGFRWRFLDGCLYVAQDMMLQSFLDKIHNHDPIVSKSQHGGLINADFRTVDFYQLSQIISKFAGIEIRVLYNIRGNMMIRAIDTPWEHVLLSMVYLNGLKMIESDFSITITP